jgi:hypothetical protein
MAHTVPFLPWPSVPTALPTDRVALRVLCRWELRQALTSGLHEYLSDRFNRLDLPAIGFALSALLHAMVNGTDNVSLRGSHSVHALPHCLPCSVLRAH